MRPLCRIRLLGGLRVDHSDGRDIRRFQTAKTGLLLAHLALHPDRPHPRESLCELLWPDNDPASSRHKLRMALSSLRRQLEPPGIPSGAVIRADRVFVSLNHDLVESDVDAFESAVREANQCADSGERTWLLEHADAQYGGQLLPEFYDDWVLAERDRLAELHLGALRKLARLAVEAGGLDRAEVYARRAVEADPLREELHRDLMRVLAASGQPSAAMKEYRRLEEMLRDQLDATPSTESNVLAEALCKRASKDFRASTPHPPGLKDHAEYDSVHREQAILRGPRLPVYLDRFFGREEETISLVRQLSPESPGRARLVTLIGPGGSGKSRLAVEVARELEPLLFDAVWFCGLADVTDVDRIPETVRDALSIALDPHCDALAQVCAFLQDRKAFVVLDNLEHLIPDAGHFVHTLLERAPGLSVLATSRSPLGLSGERQFPVLPLPLPDPGQSAEEMVDCPSVRMFVDRAQAVKPDFQVTPRTADDLAAICRSLEGVPLAIELAAARMNLLTLSRIRREVTEGLGVLVSHKRDIPERHRSLRAAIEWSDRLLSPELRRFFNRLSVFAGGCTGESAAVVCDEPQAGEHLTQLCEWSLLTVDLTEPETRFRLLETLREFAREQLSPEEWRNLSERHASYFANLAEGTLSRRSYGDAGRMDRIMAEYGNFRAVLDRSVEGPTEPRSSITDGAASALCAMVDCGLRIAAALDRFWAASGRVHEGRDYLARLLANVPPQGRTGTLSRALEVAASLAVYDYDAVTVRELTLQTLSIAREFADREGIANGLNNLAYIALQNGEYAEARTLLEESVAIVREIGGDAHKATESLNTLASVLHRVGCFAEARSLYEESLQRLRGSGYAGSIAFTQLSFAVLIESMGDPEFSLAKLHDALVIEREIQNRWGVGECLKQMGYLHWRRKDLESAERCWEEALELSPEVSDLALTSDILCGLALLAADRQDPVTAHERFSESLRIRGQLRLKPRIAASLDAAAYIAFRAGHPDRAARLFGAAESLWDAMGETPSAIGRGDYRMSIQETKTSLGSDLFDAAWHEGSAMTMDGAIDYALREKASGLIHS